MDTQLIRHMTWICLLCHAVDPLIDSLSTVDLIKTAETAETADFLSSMKNDTDVRV